MLRAATRRTLAPSARLLGLGRCGVRTVAARWFKHAATMRAASVESPAGLSTPVTPGVHQPHTVTLPPAPYRKPVHKKKQKKGAVVVAPPPPPPMQYLSFFLYTPLTTDALLAVRDELHALLASLGAFGRIFLATEGINAQMCTPVGTMPQLELGMHALHGGVFAKVVFTLGDVHQPRTPAAEAADPTLIGSTGEAPFTALHVRVRHRLVADGLDATTHAKMDLHDHGTGLDAEQWHKEIEQVQAGAAHPHTRIIDCRNWFESEIGGFAASIPLDTDLYRESFQKLDEIFSNADQEAKAPMAPGTAKPATYIYCTGGIRCVKVGAYLRSKGHPHDVKFLKGGINSYAKLVQEKTREVEATTNPSTSPAPESPPAFKSTYIGKNFVFDSRIKEGNASVRISEHVIGSCHQCGVACDVHNNCRNLRCDVLFLQCPTCAASYERTCSEACRDVVHAVRAQTLAYTDLPPHPGQHLYRRRVGLAATKGGKTTTSSLASSPSTANQPTGLSFHSWARPRSFSSIASPSVAVSPSAAQLEAYCVQHSTPAASASILSAISSRTHAAMPERANMLSDALVGGVLRSLATATLAHSSDPRLLELGAFTGYSTSWLLDALPPGRGLLLSCELKEEYATIARQNLADHPNYSRLQLVVAPALDTLQSLVAGGLPSVLASSPSNDLGFDFIYLDANKKSYLASYEFILAHGLLRRGGVLLADNTLWKGEVVAPASELGSMARSMHRFNETLAADPRVVTTMLPIRDGLTIVQRRD